MKKAIATVLTLTALIPLTAHAVEYEPMSVPSLNTSFKTYMDYRAITNHSSPQWKMISEWAWTDCNGFLRCNGERDLGISDDYYVVAMGSGYGTQIGSKYRITTDTGNVFYAVLGDCKANSDTDSTNRYGRNGDVVEMIVDTHTLTPDVKYMGSANVYAPLNGSIISIERMSFEW